LLDRLNSFSSGDQANIPTVVQRELWAMANSAWLGFVNETADRYGYSFGIEARHPFLDRRLTEFCLSLPEAQRWRRDEMKFVLRNAMKGIVPEDIRMRRTKGEFSRVMASYLLSPEVQEWLESSKLGSFGWINQSALLEMHSQLNAEFRNGRNYSRFIWPLSMIAGVECWVKFAV
jgi:asparagine synthase (glutamine-hydrolysing)